MGRVKQCRAVLLDVRQCSAATAARMLRELLATDTLLPPAIAANVLTAADLLDSLPKAAQHEAPAVTAKQTSAQAQGMDAPLCCGDVVREPARNAQLRVPVADEPDIEQQLVIPRPAPFWQTDSAALTRSRSARMARSGATCRSGRQTTTRCLRQSMAHHADHLMERRQTQPTVSDAKRRSGSGRRLLRKAPRIWVQQQGPLQRLRVRQRMVSKPDTRRNERNTRLLWNLLLQALLDIPSLPCGGLHHSAVSDLRDILVNRSAGV